MEIVCLPIDVGHNCFGDVHTCFLQHSDNLKWRTWIPSGMNNNRTAQLSLGMSCCLKNLPFALSQRPGATDFSDDATPDTRSISSTENFINENVSKLRKREKENVLETVEFINPESPWYVNGFIHSVIHSFKNVFAIHSIHTGR